MLVNNCSYKIYIKKIENVKRNKHIIFIKNVTIRNFANNP